MLPYGKRSKLRHNYPDCHPKRLGKGWLNWWEVDLGGVDKKSERQKAKRSIKREIFNED